MNRLRLLTKYTINPIKRYKFQEPLNNIENNMINMKEKTNKNEKMKYIMWQTYLTKKNKKKD